jgi:hypothetical protein
LLQSTPTGLQEGSFTKLSTETIFCKRSDLIQPLFGAHVVNFDLMSQETSMKIRGLTGTISRACPMVTDSIKAAASGLGQHIDERCETS